MSSLANGPRHPVRTVAATSARDFLEKIKYPFVIYYGEKVLKSFSWSYLDLLLGFMFEL